MPQRNLKSLDTLILHCSATPNGRWHTVEDVDRWHGERGFRRDPALIGCNQPALAHIGYHFVIYTTGAVAIGRGLKEVGAHAAGHNATSVGTCLIGTDQFTPDQWASLRSHVETLMKLHPGLRVVGHRAVSREGKTCPGFDVPAWLEGGLAPLAGHVLPTP